MHIDDHDHQLARVQPLVDLFLQGAVVVAVEEVVFHDLILIDELLELLLGAVVVVYPFLLPGAGGTGGGRNRFSISGWALRKALTTLSFPVPAAPETTNRYFSFSMVLLLLFCHCFALGLTGGTAGYRFGLKG